jgi:hypothetical protein
MISNAISAAALTIPAATCGSESQQRAAAIALRIRDVAKRSPNRPPLLIPATLDSDHTASDPNGPALLDQNKSESSPVVHYQPRSSGA